MCQTCSLCSILWYTNNNLKFFPKTEYLILSKFFTLDYGVDLNSTASEDFFQGSGKFSRRRLGGGGANIWLKNNKTDKIQIFLVKVQKPTNTGGGPGGGGRPTCPLLRTPIIWVTVYLYKLFIFQRQMNYMINVSGLSDLIFQKDKFHHLNSSIKPGKVIIILPCVSRIWTSLTWLWWCGFRLKPISGIDWATQRIVANVKSGQNWHKNIILLLHSKFILNPWYTPYL